MKPARQWAVVVFVAAILELIGLARRKRGDTLSEYTWSKTRHPVVAGLVLALVSWLPYHFSYGRYTDGLGWWDLLSAVLGAGLGVAATLGRKR